MARLHLLLKTALNFAEIKLDGICLRCKFEGCPLTLNFVYLAAAYTVLNGLLSSGELHRDYNVVGTQSKQKNKFY